MEHIAPAQEEIHRRSLDDLPERLERFREVARLSWRELASCLGVAEEHVAAWRERWVPGGFKALYPEFAVGPADEGDEGEEPWA